MSKCQICGTEILEGSNYCVNCGVKIDEQQIVLPNKKQKLKKKTKTRVILFICGFLIVMCVTAVMMILPNIKISEDEGYQIACQQLEQDIYQANVEKGYAGNLDDEVRIDVDNCEKQMCYDFEDIDLDRWKALFAVNYVFIIKSSSEDLYVIAGVEGTRWDYRCVINDINGISIQEWVENEHLRIESQNEKSSKAYYEASLKAHEQLYGKSDENTTNRISDTSKDNRAEDVSGNDNRNETDALDELILNSDSVYLESVYDLSCYTEDELRKIRNGIYARHGYIFQDQELTDYFSHKSYYNPSVTRAEWKESVLNQIEKDNVQALLRWEGGEDSDLGQEDSIAITSEDLGGDITLKELFNCVINSEDEYTSGYEQEGFSYEYDYNKALNRGMTATYLGEDEGEQEYEIQVPGEYYMTDNDFSREAFAQYKVYYKKWEKEFDEEQGESHKKQYYLYSERDYYYYD